MNEANLGVQHNIRTYFFDVTFRLTHNGEIYKVFLHIFLAVEKFVSEHTILHIYFGSEIIPGCKMVPLEITKNGNTILRCFHKPQSLYQSESRISWKR